MTLRPGRRAAGIERTLIRKVFDAAPAGAINLGLGQPDLPSPPAAGLGGVAAIARGAVGYSATAGDPELRAAVAARHRPFCAGPEEVLVTVGSQEALLVACLTLLDPGDELLYPDPGYPAYPVVARLAGAVATPYRLRRERGFRLGAADVLQRITPRTRVVLLCSPSNPTGACTPRDELATLAEALDRRGVGWISDELYAELTYGVEPASPSAASRNGVVVSGVSKALSMAGWRIGWLVGPRKVLERATAIHQYVVTCAPTVSQRAALAALTEPDERTVRTYRERFAGRRELMARELGRAPGLRFEPPDGAFYFFVDVSAFGDSRSVARRILDRCEVITVPGVAFGEGGEGHLRISFAADEADIVEGVGRIAAELGSDRRPTRGP